MRRHKSYLNILFPIGLIIVFLLEGSICKMFSNVLFLKFPMVPYLTLLWIVYASLFESHEDLHLYWWAFGIGIIYDLYYVGIIGVFTFIFPLIVYLNNIALKYLDENILTSGVIYGCDLIVVIFLSYLADRIAHIVALSGLQVVLYALIPTIFLNLVLYAIFYFPVSWIYNKLR